MCFDAVQPDGVLHADASCAQHGREGVQHEHDPGLHLPAHQHPKRQVRWSPLELVALMVTDLIAARGLFTKDLLAGPTLQILCMGSAQIVS